MKFWQKGKKGIQMYQGMSDHGELGSGLDFNK